MLNRKLFDETLILRTVVASLMIILAATLRIAPHPWNFAPIGAMALFSGATLRDRRLTLLLPLAALFAGDLFIGLHKLIPVVYASTLLTVLIGKWLENHRPVARIGAAVFLGALQFFILTNFSVWALLGSYPHNFMGLVACYVAGIPFFWNTLAGDTFYSTILFGGFALAEYLLPALRAYPARARS
jgi:hypothetical protein